MSRVSRLFKKYERHFLLGLTVLLLTTFSITGALQCARRGAHGVDVGGSFLATPTERVSFTSQEVTAARMRYWEKGRRALEGPTLRYRPYLQKAAWPAAWVATWVHIVLTESARAAGFRVGDAQRDTAVKQVVSNATGLEFSEANFERFLRNEYRGSASDLRETVRDVVLTDTYLEPFVEAARYRTGYDEAYETWKSERERVDLAFVALSADPFADAVKAEERTRSALARQEDLLAKAASAARQVRLLVGSAQAHERQKGKPAETLADLQGVGAGTAGAKDDPWGHPLAFERRDGKPWPSSAGPDGTAGTADDVTPETLQSFETHAVLREVANALRQWREATKAWPDSIARLRERPAENALPPLKRTEVKDGWGRDLVYEAGTEGGAPRLASAGPDGQPGTADDVVVEIDADVLRVPVGPGLAAYLRTDLRDAWDRPLRAQMKSPEGWILQVSSAGPDGAWGTPDDILEGNEAEMREFFSRPAVKPDFVEPIRRRFDAIVAQLPLLPDDVLKAMWESEALKGFRPADEEKLFEQWRFYKDRPLYGAADPRDPETGYGAALAKRLAPDAKAWLVPDRTVFGELPEAFAKTEDPLRKEYVEKGWREVVLREYFLENVLNDVLAKARVARDARKAWEEKKARGEDPGEAPAEATLASLFEATFRPFLPAGEVPYLRAYSTPGLITQAEWEAIPGLDDLNFSANMSRATGAGDLAPIVIPLHERMARVVAQNLEFRGQRQREFEEVREDEAFLGRYLASKQLSRARRELESLRRQVEAKEQGTEGAAREEAFAQALKEWNASLGVSCVLESTGLFIGAVPPPPVKVPEEASEEEALRLRRRNFVWQAGYSTVRPSPSRQDAVDATPGTFGRTVLEDAATGPDATRSAFLIRVKDRRYPALEELSPTRWSEIAIQKYFGDLLFNPNRLNKTLHMREGAAFEVLGSFLDDLDAFQARYELRTNADLGQAGRMPAE